jgi:tetratricopeptide (TPR) repeat protein
MAQRLRLLQSPEALELHRYATEAYLLGGASKLALAEYERHLAYPELAADSANWVTYLRLGGWAFLEAGQPEKALPILERALTLTAAHPFYPGWVARLRYQTAKALVLTHGDRKRAWDLVNQAHDELVNVPVAKDLLAEVDAWREQVFQRERQLTARRP